MILTKSKFLMGLECPRCFWKAMHGNVKSELSIQQEQNIKNGIEIGNIAKNLFYNAEDLSNMSSECNIEATKNSLMLKRIIFEAGFSINNLYARIDILVPNSDESWDIVEVKSRTKVTTNHIYDVAFERYVCESAGIKINKCYILHLNANYVKDEELNLEELFIKEEITTEVEEFYPRIPKLIEGLIKIYNLPEAPKANIDNCLFKEFSCEFDSECWPFLPEDNVRKLYKMRKNKIADLIRKDIFSISEVPNDMLNHNQLIQKRAIVGNKTYIDKIGIKSFVNTLEYPIYYFDFETFMEPIPRFMGSKVYAQIPFQYSLHIQYEDGTLEHHEFLHKDNTDPRKPILVSMLKALGDRGSVVVFNQTFEKTRLKELAELYPEYQSSINNILDRIVDLLVPFSKFYYYNPIQKESCSIKKVLPAVTGKSYEDMEIGNGGDASTLYFKATFGEEFSREEKEKIYNDLLEYCNLDTVGMVWIVDELKRIIE